jgi:hypothetical protein
MEEVLDLYEELADPQRPRVCFDETPKQLVAETQSPLPLRECFENQVCVVNRRNMRRILAA